MIKVQLKAIARGKEVRVRLLPSWHNRDYIVEGLPEGGILEMEEERYRNREIHVARPKSRRGPASVVESKKVFKHWLEVEGEDNTYFYEPVNPIHLLTRPDLTREASFNQYV